VEFPAVMCNVDMPYKVNILRLEHFWAQKKVQNEVIPTGTLIGQNEEWKPLKLVVHVANMATKQRKHNMGITVYNGRWGRKAGNEM
jgi:hypothetical protein